MSPDVVVLVDVDGRERGVADRLVAHREPGQLHAAVSVMVFDDAGRVLIQQRAPGKALFGSWWSNSCCTHPAPGESAAEAGERRAFEELGVRVHGLVEAGAFVYRARDRSTGLVELERDTVVLARSADTPVADPVEVCAWQWVSLDALEGSRRFTPWAERVHTLGAAWGSGTAAGTHGASGGG
ncbi:MAG: isopentenyl-diphosphate Delta-isomerase [Thermoleophilaceae bacterium]